MRTQYCGLLDATYVGKSVTLFGWVHRRRDHGGVIFIDLRDREGLVQIVCDPDRREVFATAEKIRNEYCLQVVGTVRRRPEGTANPNLVSGEIEVLCQELVNQTDQMPHFNSFVVSVGLKDFRRNVRLPVGKTMPFCR